MLCCDDDKYLKKINHSNKASMRLKRGTRTIMELRVFSLLCIQKQYQQVLVEKLVFDNEKQEHIASEMNQTNNADDVFPDRSLTSNPTDESDQQR